MPLRRKLLTSFIGVASLILLVGITGIIISLTVASSFGTVLSTTAPAIGALLRASAAAGNMREIAYSYSFLAVNLDSANAEDVATVDAEFVLLMAGLDEYRAVTQQPTYYEDIASSADALYQVILELMRFADTGVASELIGNQFEAVEAAELTYDTALEEALNVETSTSITSINTSGQIALAGAAIYIVAMISGILIAIILGVVVSRQIVNRVRQLQTVAEKMMSGDYAQRAQMTTGDEIGQLGSAFDIMAASIQKRDEDLSTINQTLEKRVDERTQELRAATLEAQEASRLKDEFLSLMSHELRTPLNAIIGFQGIVLMVGGVSERSKHMLQRAQANADRLLELINDILDVSRIESGRLALVNTDVALVPFMQRLQERMSVLADQKHLAFTVDVGRSVPETISIDEDAITKILTNLLGNAFKFTDHGSVKVRLNRSGDDLVIAVKDTGIGIPSHMQHIIFERFRQVDGSSTRTHGGSGLGLSIVQKLCFAMGGTVQVESAVGEGSTFTVVLPLNLLETRPADVQELAS